MDVPGGTQVQDEGLGDDLHRPYCFIGVPSNARVAMIYGAKNF